MKNNGIIISILVALTGLMMVSSPSTFISAIVVLSGVAAVVNGTINLTVTRSLLADNAFKLNMTMRGVSNILMGVLAVALPLVVAKITWFIMVRVLAVYLIIAVFMEIFAIFKLLRSKMVVKQYVLETVVTLLLSVLLFMLPADFGFFVVRIGGAILLVVATALVFYSLKYAPSVTVIEPDSVENDTSAE